MRRQLFLVLFLGVFLIQVASAHDEVDNVRGILQDIVQKVKEAIKRLITRIEQAARDAVQKVINAKLKPAIDEIQKIASIKVNKEIEFYEQEVSTIVAQTDAIPVDITSCTNESKNKVNTITKETRAQLSKCLSHKLIQLSQAVQAALKSIANLKKTAQNLNHAESICGGGLFAIPCYSKLLARLVKATIEFPLQITAEAAKVIKLLDTLHPEVKQCGTVSLAEFYTRMEQVIPKIEKCVESVIDIQKLP